MLGEKLLELALNMGAENGWVVPSKEELASLDVDGVAAWMVEHNPDKAQVIKERLSIYKQLM